MILVIDMVSGETRSAVAAPPMQPQGWQCPAEERTALTEIVAEVPRAPRFPAELLQVDPEEFLRRME